MTSIQGYRRLPNLETGPPSPSGEALVASAAIAAGILTVALIVASSESTNQEVFVPTGTTEATEQVVEIVPTVTISDRADIR